jgi:nucleoside-diphosphate-sugar epimerase
MKIYCETVFDITATGVTGHFKSSRIPFIDHAGHKITDSDSWNRARNQQRNWETLTQLIQLRTQIDNIVKVVSDQQMILYPNTNSGYGVGEDGKFCTEESPLNPISVYGESKVAAEKLLMESTSAVCFRLATVFGSSLRMRTDLLVNEFVYKALTDKYIVVFERHFKRNFIHIQDVSRVFYHGLHNYETMKHNVYNVGLSDANLSKQELLEKIQQYIPDFAITYSDFYEDPDKRDYIVSNEKIEKTDWKPKYSLDDGIEELIKTYQVLIPRMTSEFRNGFPLGYANNT